MTDQIPRSSVATGQNPGRGKAVFVRLRGSLNDDSAGESSLASEMFEKT